MFKRRRLPVEVILLCVRWYCKYGISYRGLVEDDAGTQRGSGPVDDHALGVPRQNVIRCE
jgi:hypothetical protein